MNQTQKVLLFLLRISFGWMFLYSGFTKITDPEFSAAGYLNSAANFSGLFSWLASPEMLPIVNFLNEWGQLLLGASLILGVFVSLSAILGALLMVLYYLPLSFPHPNSHSFIVDEHIIYALSLLLLAALGAGRVMGLAKWCSNLAIYKNSPTFRKLIG